MTLRPPSPFILGQNLVGFCFDPSLPIWADDPNSALFFWQASLNRLCMDCVALIYCTSMFLPGAAAKKAVNMKVIDDKLKIIDDVPSSAVEMAVKEKVTAFLNC